MQASDIVSAISSLAPLRSDDMGDLEPELFAERGFKLAQAFPFMHTFVSGEHYRFNELGISPNWMFLDGSEKKACRN